MKIVNHLLEGDQVTQKKSPNISGKFGSGLSDTLVIHFTGGRSAASSAKWLCDPAAKASAHVVLGQKGEIIQLVPFNTIAWHAGKSQWGDRYGLNKYSIGIEIDNPGRLEKRENGFSTWFGTKVSDDDVVQATHRNEDSPTYWHAYKEQQIVAAMELCWLLMDTYDIKVILGHEEISPGRKVDPGPAFPLDKIRNELLYQDRGSDDPESFEEVVLEAKTSGYVTANLLNIRSSPSISASMVTKPLPKGTLVKVIEQQGKWSKVKVETEGWVSSDYIKTH